MGSCREGEEWNALRKPISQLAMPPKKVAEYYMQMNEVAYDLIEIFQKQRDRAGVYHNVTDLSFRWALECELACRHTATCWGILYNPCCII